MTVRNPLDRLRSEFLWRVRGNSADPNAWVQHVLHEYSLDKFILDNHLRPQIEFLIEGADIFKTENQFDQNWLNSINAKAKLNLQILPNGKANCSKDLTGRTIDDVHLSAHFLDLVQQFYVQDYERFGYSLA